MAIIPLNAFRNIAAKLTTTQQLIYDTPIGVSSIVLSAICANYTANDVPVTFKIQKTVLVENVPTTIEYFIVPTINVIANDVLSVVAGRLVLEQGDKLYASAGANNAVDFVMSINEAANE